jgi:hypothetical protein
MLASTLGKRSRDVEEANGQMFDAGNDDQECDRRKRVKGKVIANRVLEAAGSTGRARQNPATMTPGVYNRKFEAAERGAGRLALPNAHGIYHRILPGPSVQGETTGTAAQVQLPWVEGSEESAAWQYVSSVAQPQLVISSAKDGEQEEAESDPFRIPKRLGERHRGLLKATSDDWARGTVRELKCRLCPGAAFSNWEDFKRHCDLMEAHPLKISFCGFCGDFFARADSQARHCKSRPPECLGVTPVEALAKRVETERIHREFQEKLERCLRDDEDIGTPFSQMIKEMFPGSSKRGSRQQSRLKAPTS